MMTSTVVFVDSDALMDIRLYTPEYSSTIEQETRIISYETITIVYCNSFERLLIYYHTQSNLSWSDDKK